eukprot:CAMPEP_0196759740 /NCGR_PEP_ID=MMETSP1091-20130531/104856_1 /TAXON_ID=302021 /ORGANISM="Rhodomonas sp., Strain CCMP768" /LENGTH=340 /DNA_ID=CAMNT_0042108599 /DNA_START=56 /DNA_END=1078 /DNA_ORIENTATION=+
MEDLDYQGPRWVQDHVAFWCCNPECNVEFSVFVRKHHCRHCGKVFCDRCSRNKRALMKFGFTTPVRLCDACNIACFRADLLLNAVGLNDLSTVEKICDEGCDVHATTTLFPALTIAANRGSVLMVQLLLEYKANPNLAVSSALGSGNCQCFKCGMTQPAGSPKCGGCCAPLRQDVTDSDHVGITALHAAVQREGHVSVLEELLGAGADVDARTAKGNSALMYAAAAGHVECCAVLLAKKADTSLCAAATGDSALHLAARAGHESVAALLLDARASLAVPNASGQTPADLAASRQHTQVAALIEEAAAHGAGGEDDLQSDSETRHRGHGGTQAQAGNGAAQ